jgi:tetraacyldisaccharide 4'-kinase
MRIVERYPVRFRMLAGAGVWALLYPLRVLLAGAYRIWLSCPRRAAAARSAAPLMKPAPSAGRRPMVVSIGNIEAGGGGKTPCALCIAAGIGTRGGRAVVVSRGYRSMAERHAPCVVPAGHELPAGSAGMDFVLDEALLKRFSAAAGDAARPASVLGDETLLYRERGIPVIIDPVRTRGAELARRLFSPTHILLDDAFQNRSIAKDIDVVLLDAERPFGTGHLLPLGTLRESPSAVRRADVVLFTRSRGEGAPRDAERLVAGKRVFFAIHEPRDLINRRRETVPLALLAGRSCVLFSGIARPGSFEQTVLSLGARPAAAFRFIDHHEYRRADVEEMLRSGAQDTPFVTTEKDWHKAAGLFPDGIDLFALRVEMRIEGFEELLDLVLSSSFS